MRDKIEVHLHTNDNCNLRCAHCYNKSGETPTCNVLETDFLLELIQYFCTEYEAEIHLEGGEIFLRPDLLCEMNSFPTETLRCITITTNGTICIDKPEILNMFRKLHRLRISVEGHRDEQQRIVRGIPLKEVIEHALFYKEGNIPLCLRLTMTRLNYEHLLDETLPYYMDMGFQHFQVYEFQAVGRGKSNQDFLSIDDDAFSSFLENLSEWKGLFNARDLSLKFMFSRVRQEAILSHKEVLQSKGAKVFDIPCEDGVSIHADGSLYLCAWDNDENHCILNVYKDGILHMGEKLRQMNLKHTCNHCSAVCIAIGYAADDRGMTRIC